MKLMLSWGSLKILKINVYIATILQKLRTHIAGLFLLLSLTLALPADYWHSCSHEEDLHELPSADTELGQVQADCVLCDYVSPEIAFNSFAISLLGNAPFWHAPIQNQASIPLESPEHPNLRGPPIG